MPNVSYPTLKKEKVTRVVDDGGNEFHKVKPGEGKKSTTAKQYVVDGSLGYYEPGAAPPVAASSQPL